MKKFLTLISVIALTAAIVLTFASCGECKHENASSSVTAPTCTERGYTTYTCNDCGHTYVDNYVDALDHCYSENLIFDSTHHYYECICGEKKDEATHVSSGAATVENDEVCAVCGYVINKAVGIKFNTLTVNGNNVYGKVSNDTEIYSFIGEVVTVGGATYVVSYKLDGGDVITTKTLSLNVGDNTVYVTEYINNEPTNICIVTIRRRPMYEVTFNSNGGTAVDSITVEEDSLIEAPEITRAGYTLVSWDYDFAAPITKDTNINASWEANTDTKYTVEYYLENIGGDYTMVESAVLYGTTDTIIAAQKKTFEHFTFNASASTMSGNINGDGSLVLKVYYTRDRYTVVSNDDLLGTVNSSGRYAYDERISVSAASIKLGYDFIGWYSNGKLISTCRELTINIDKNIEARFGILPEMENFEFTSTATSCSIIGIKDKTVTEIIVPSYVTRIGASAFSGCSNLESITLPFVGSSSTATSASSSTLFGYIFGTASYEGGIATQQYYKSGSSCTYYIPKTLMTVTITGGEIFFGAFCDCTSLTSVTIPNNVTSIGDNAFSGCKNLISVIVGDSVVTIGSHAFSWCVSIRSITIGNSVTTIGSDAFYECDKLFEVVNNSALDIKAGTLTNGGVGSRAVEVHIGKSKLVNKDNYLFYTYDGTNYLFGYVGVNTEITLPKNYNGELYQIYSNAFEGCTNLTSVTISDGVTSIGNGAFYGCESLTSVTISDSVTSIGYSAFKWCFRLESVTIGNSVVYIGSSAFEETGLTSITIPDSVTTIGSWAFFSCTRLANVTIGKSVTTIDAGAFSGCIRLTIIKYRGSKEQWNDITKGGGWDQNTGVYTLTTTKQISD